MNSVSARSLKRLAFSIWLAITVGIIIEVAINNTMSDAGETLVRIQSKIDEVKLENSLLEERIDNARSLRHIKNVSIPLNFKENGKRINYITPKDVNPEAEQATY